MPFLAIVLAVLVVGALTAALVWLVGSRPGALADQALADPVSGSPFQGLPDGRLGPGEVRDLRFDQVLRGYRMDQVDDVLDRLAEELRRRDEEILTLRSRAAAGPVDADVALDPSAHPDVTTGPLEVSEIVRPSGSSRLWSRADRSGTPEP